MLDLMCKLEGLLMDNKLSEAENMYMEFAKLLPYDAKIAFTSELFQRRMQKEVVLKANATITKETARQNFHALFNLNKGV